MHRANHDDAVTMPTPSGRAWSGQVRSLAGLSDVRGDVRAVLLALDRRADCLEDVTLVLTELVVNAFVHGGTDRVDIDLDVRLDDVLIRLSHRDRAHTQFLARSSMADPSSPTGRGRAIVERLSTSMTLTPATDGSWVQSVIMPCAPKA